MTNKLSRRLAIPKGRQTIRKGTSITGVTGKVSRGRSGSGRSIRSPAPCWQSSRPPT